MFCLKSVISDLHSRHFASHRLCFSAFWLSISLINFTAPLESYLTKVNTSTRPWGPTGKLNNHVKLGGENCQQYHRLTSHPWVSLRQLARQWDLGAGAGAVPHARWPETISRWHQAMGTVLASIRKMPDSFLIILWFRFPRTTKSPKDWIFLNILDFMYSFDLMHVHPCHVLLLLRIQWKQFSHGVYPYCKYSFFDLTFYMKCRRPISIGAFCFHTLLTHINV